MLRVGQMNPKRIITDHIRSVFFHAGYVIQDDGAIFDIRPDELKPGEHPREQFWNWIRLMQDKGIFERAREGVFFNTDQIPDDDLQALAPGA